MDELISIVMEKGSDSVRSGNGGSGGSGDNSDESGA